MVYIILNNLALILFFILFCVISLMVFSEQTLPLLLRIPLGLLTFYLGLFVFQWWI